MRTYVLLVAMVATLIACDLTPSSSTDVHITNTQTQNPPDTSVEPAAPIPGVNNVTMDLVPDSVTVDVDSNVFVKVVITTPAGNEVPTEGLSVSIGDTSIAIVSEIDGRSVGIRGQAAGVTSAIFNANGISKSLVITVNP